jgi:phosphoglycolate phosphatase
VIPRLIVFDLDGTLIDSRRDLADATNALVGELGADPLPEETVAAMVGEGAALLVRRALTAARLDPDTPGALDRFLGHYERRLLVHTRPYEGVREALEALTASGPLAVLTNKPAAPTNAILEALELAPFFDQILGGDTPFGRKPDPAGLLHLVRGAGATPASTVLVGDSPIDRETASRAGTRVCLVRYGFGFRFAAEELNGVDVVIDRADELPDALKKV